MDYLDGIDEQEMHFFREQASAYYKEEGRHEFPWRETKDPWKILLAEMLLRKTTAAQAESVYQQLSKYSPQELRDAPREELEELLKPLGIYQERARLMKLVGEKVAEEGRDKLSDWDFLISLPGIGPYAASMVLSTVFGEKKPGLDRNMFRVLDRVFSIKSDKARPHTDRELWKTAEEIMPEEETKDYNWGVMDLAAEICRPRNPKCSQCPLLKICDFGQKRSMNEAKNNE